MWRASPNNRTEIARKHFRDALPCLRAHDRQVAVIGVSLNPCDARASSMHPAKGLP